MAADFYIKQHDRLPSIQSTLSISGQVVDLTGATVKFIMASPGGGTPKVNATATVVSPTLGLVQYDWLLVDTSSSGTFLAEWQVTFASGKQQTFPNNGNHVIQITPDLDGA